MRSVQTWNFAPSFVQTSLYKRILCAFVRWQNSAADFCGNLNAHHTYLTLYSPRRKQILFYSFCAMIAQTKPSPAGEGGGEADG